MSIAIAAICSRWTAVSPKAQKASRLSRLRSSATKSTRAPSRSLTTVTKSYRRWKDFSSTPT